MRQRVSYWRDAPMYRQYNELPPERGGTPEGEPASVDEKGFYIGQLVRVRDRVDETTRDAQIQALNPIEAGIRRDAIWQRGELSFEWDVVEPADGLKTPRPGIPHRLHKTTRAAQAGRAVFKSALAGIQGLEDIGEFESADSGAD